MSNFSKVFFSESDGGRPIKISATSTPGTLIHTTDVSSSVIDEVWLYVHNTSGTKRNVTLELGGTTNPDDRILFGVEGGTGMDLVLPGVLLRGNDVSGKELRVFCDSADVVTVIGYVNRAS